MFAVIFKVNPRPGRQDDDLAYAAMLRPRIGAGGSAAPANHHLPAREIVAGPHSDSLPPQKQSDVALIGVAKAVSGTPPVPRP